MVSILRLQSLYFASESTDPTYDNVSIAIWSTIELNTAVLCGCLPTLKPLLARTFPRFFQTAHTHGYYQHHNSGRGTRHETKTTHSTAGRRTSCGNPHPRPGSDTDELHPQTLELGELEAQTMRSEGDGSLKGSRG